MKKIALYVRVSTQEQKLHGLSVDSQISALTEFCERNDYQIVKIYNDAGHTARKKYTTRPALMCLLADCKHGMFEQVLFTRIDRWFRSVGDYHAIQSILEENNVNWKAIWEDYETETSAGRFKVNIMLSIAEAEADRTAERIKAINQYKRDKGQWVASNLPWGYVWQDKKIVKDKEVEPIINLIISTYEKTASLSDVAMTVHSAGHKDVTKYKIKRVLTYEFYVGRANMEQYEPYLTEEQFRRFTEIQSRRSRQRNPQKCTFIFSGLLKCEKCGRQMLSHHHHCQRKTKSGTRTDFYKMYRCGGHQQYQCLESFTKLETVIERMMVAEVDKKVASLSISATLDTSDDKIITKKINALNSRLKRITDLYELGDLERDEYIRKRDAIKLDISHLEASKVQPSVPSLPSNWKDVYMSLDDKHKRAFWQNIIKSVIVHRDSVEITFVCT